MSPLERQHLSELEPELRSSSLRARLPRRKLPRNLVVLMVALRAYVVLALGLVLAAFLHAVRP